MSELDILKLLQHYGEETDLADFTPDELQELLERMQADGDELPLSKEAFKERYFAYYDDVKDKSLKKQDWWKNVYMRRNTSSGLRFSWLVYAQ